jgi:hypothetical protein
MDGTGQARRFARTGSWLIDFPLNSDATIAEGIEAFFRGFPSDKELWATLNERFSVDLLCDVLIRGVNQGFALPARTMELLAQRGIELGVEIYCESDQEQASVLRERLEAFDERRSTAR